MKKILTAAALAAFAISPIAANATVQPIDWNHDGLNFVAGYSPANPYKPQQTFYDSANGLLWTNANLTITDANGMTLSGTNTFLSMFNASTNLATWNNEGLHTWRLPTQEEFTALIDTQGKGNNQQMILLPFSAGHHYVWTSTSTTTANNGQPAHWAFAPNGGSFKTFADINNVSMDVWAVTTVTAAPIARPVTPVPEPETYAMLLAGLGLIGAVARRRQAK